MPSRNSAMRAKPMTSRYSLPMPADQFFKSSLRQTLSAAAPAWQSIESQQRYLDSR
jgi:hypothetical protein